MNVLYIICPVDGTLPSQDTCNLCGWWLMTIKPRKRKQQKHIKFQK